MPQITFTDDQKRQLVGWLNNEKDYLLSATTMSERILIPRVTGTLELLLSDLEFVRRLRRTIKGYDENGVPTRAPDDKVELSYQDTETLVDIARSNRYENREVFWRSIIESIEGTKVDDQNPSTVQ